MALLKPYDFLIFSQEALTCLRPGGYNIREEVRDMEANILVVDDEPEIADLVGVYLKSEGFTVFTCGTAAEALACVQRGRRLYHQALQSAGAGGAGQGAASEIHPL